MIPKGMDHEKAHAAHAQIAAESRQFYAGTKHGATETRAYIKKAWALFCAGQPYDLKAMKGEVEAMPQAEAVVAPPPPEPRLPHTPRRKLVGG